MIKDEVADEWAEKAVRLNTLKVATKSTSMSPSEASALLADLEQRTRLHQSPQILFTQLGQKFASHTVLVSEVKRLGGGVSRICIRDNNAYPSERSGCRHYLDVHSSGQVQGNSTFWNVAGVGVAPNEDADTIEQLHSLRDKCQAKKGCSKG